MLKRFFIITTLICVIVSLTACGKIDTPTIRPPEDMSGTPGDVMIPDASDTTTGDMESNAPEETTHPETSSTTTSPTANNSTGTNSRQTNPPTNNTPSQPTTQTPPPATSTAPPPTTSTPPPSKPTYTEADYQAIINEIRKYGEDIGFVWNDNFVFGQEGLGYYGRPNLERDGYDGVISMLKFHCDKIDTQYGDCYFKVVKHLYAGNTEFVVLYM